MYFIFSAPWLVHGQGTANDNDAFHFARQTSGELPISSGRRAQRLSNGDGGQPDLLSDHHPVEVDKFTDELAVSTKLAKYGPPIVMPVGGSQFPRGRSSGPSLVLRARLWHPTRPRRRVMNTVNMEIARSLEPM